MAAITASVVGKNPVAYYYGKDQTKRVGENYTPGGTGNDRLAEFKTTADEVLDGGKRDLLIITNASDAPNIDLTNAADNSILQFPVSGGTTFTFKDIVRLQVRQHSELNCTRFKKKPMIRSSHIQPDGQMHQAQHERSINSSGPTLLLLTTQKNSISSFLSVVTATGAISYASRQSHEIS